MIRKSLLGWPSIVLCINFYWGEQTIVGDSSFLMDLLVTFLGALLALLIALWIYSKEQSASKEKAKREREAIMVGELKYLVEVLRAIKQHTLEQSEQISIYIAAQKDSLTELKVLKRIANQNFKRLYTLQSKNIFEAWQSIFGNNSESFKELRSLNATLDYLEGLLSELSRLYLSHTNESLSDLRSIKTMIHQAIDELSILVRSERFRLADERFDDPYYNFVNGSISKFHELVERKANFDVINSELLLPIVKGYITFAEKPDSDRIGLMVKNARINLTEVKGHISAFCIELGRIVGEFDRLIRKLDDSIIQIERNIAAKEPH